MLPLVALGRVVCWPVPFVGRPYGPGFGDASTSQLLALDDVLDGVEVLAVPLAFFIIRATASIPAALAIEDNDIGMLGGLGGNPVPDVVL